jgi:Fe2+ transport system protein FeoA
MTSEALPLSQAPQGVYVVDRLDAQTPPALRARLLELGLTLYAPLTVWRAGSRLDLTLRRSHFVVRRAEVEGVWVRPAHSQETA